MRLIDKDALLGFEKFDAQIEEHTADDILSIIKTAPPIDPVHAAGGCYCRECKHWDREQLKTSPKEWRDKCTLCACLLHSIGDNQVYFTAEDFCSNGESREAQP